MSRRLISLTNNDAFDYDYDQWMKEINSILKNQDARVINVTCADESFDDATAWIEIDEGDKTKYVLVSQVSGEVR